jgi:hypothetical protein
VRDGNAEQIIAWPPAHDELAEVAYLTSTEDNQLRQVSHQVQRGQAGNAGRAVSYSV